MELNWTRSEEHTSELLSLGHFVRSGAVCEKLSLAPGWPGEGAGDDDELVAK